MVLRSVGKCSEKQRDDELRHDFESKNEIASFTDNIIIFLRVVYNRTCQIITKRGCSIIYIGFI